MNLIFKIIGYIFLRFAIFYGIISIMDKNVKFVKWSDLKNGEDWFYFLWLFFVPTAIEAILLTFPFYYGLNKIAYYQNKIIFYFLFAGLFFIEFIISYSLYGIQFAGIKIGISFVIFLVLFRNRLFSIM